MSLCLHTLLTLSIGTPWLSRWTTLDRLIVWATTFLSIPACPASSFKALYTQYDEYARRVRKAVDDFSGSYQKRIIKNIFYCLRFFIAFFLRLEFSLPSTLKFSFESGFSGHLVDFWSVVGWERSVLFFFALRGFWGIGGPNRHISGCFPSPPVNPLKTTRMAVT